MRIQRKSVHNYFDVERYKIIYKFFLITPPVLLEIKNECFLCTSIYLMIYIYFISFRFEEEKICLNKNIIEVNNSK